MSENINALQSRTIIANGYATADITQEQLDQWADNLTYVSYYSYGYNISGNLVPIDDESLIRNAFNSGVAPLMVLTPLDESGVYSYELVREVFTNPVMRDRLINNVVLTVTEKKYYGVVINFGYIAEEDKDQFVITVSKTSARLNRRGDLVIVSLTPGINDAGIDYESLSRAANFIELRTFQWEQIQRPPASVSPIDIIREMLTVNVARIDSRVILLGIPNYGYDWALPFIQGKSSAEMISNAEAADRAKRAGAAIQYNEIVQSPYYIYIDGEAARHAVWFDDARSIRVKLELVNDFKLAGISIWTIMSPFPAGIEIMNELYTVYKV